MLGDASQSAQGSLFLLQHFFFCCAVELWISFQHLVGGYWMDTFSLSACRRREEKDIQRRKSCSRSRGMTETVCKSLLDNTACWGHRRHPDSVVWLLSICSINLSIFLCYCVFTSFSRKTASCR